jgi:hypothetical protein
MEFIFLLSINHEDSYSRKYILSKSIQNLVLSDIFSLFNYILIIEYRLYVDLDNYFSF